MDEPLCVVFVVFLHFCLDGLQLNLLFDQLSAYTTPKRIVLFLEMLQGSIKTNQIRCESNMSK